MHNKIFSLLIFFSCFCSSAQAQQSTHYIRIAKITVDTAVLNEYLLFLKEGIETAIKKEPGVVSMYAVAEKEHPNRITILETYASRAAYEQHIQTVHFMKYKAGTLKMVQFLELTDVSPIIFQSKKSSR
jgi:4-carboxymuconolactone decarboxylase